MIVAIVEGVRSIFADKLMFEVLEEYPSNLGQKLLSIIQSLPIKRVKWES